VRRTIGDDESALAQYVGPTGKPGAVKVARPVWSGGKAVRPYLSLPFHTIPHRMLTGKTDVVRSFCMSGVRADMQKLRWCLQQQAN